MKPLIVGLGGEARGHLSWQVRGWLQSPRIRPGGSDQGLTVVTTMGQVPSAFTPSPGTSGETCSGKSIPTNKPQVRRGALIQTRAVEEAPRDWATPCITSPSPGGRSDEGRGGLIESWTVVS